MDSATAAAGAGDGGGGGQFVVGMRVRIKAISMSEARARQSVSAGWADGMRDEQLGKAGVVVLVDSDGDVHVRVDGTTASLAWSPQLLEAAELRPASAFREGAKVRIQLVSVAVAKDAMEGHGGWASDMLDCLGKTGTIVGVARSVPGDVRVRVASGVIDTWIWNSELLVLEEDFALAVAGGQDVPALVSQIVAALAAGTNPNLCGKDGSTALAAASFAAQLELLRVLLAAGAAKDAADKKGRTALHAATKPEVVKLLLDSGASASVADKAGRSPLHAACEGGLLEVARELLEGGSGLEARAVNGRTPLLAAVAAAAAASGSAVNDRQRLVQLVQLLVDRGADLAAVDKDGRTAVCLAVAGTAGGTGSGPALQAAAADLVRVLLPRGAPPGRQAGQGAELKAPSALVVAVKKKWREVAKELIAAGADLEATTSSHRRAPLHYAARKGDGAMTALLIKAGANVNVVDKGNATPFYIAVQKNKLKVMRLLLQAGCDPNIALQPAIDTPLMQAAVVGNADLVAVMLKMGGSRVNLNLATKDGWSALMLAADKGHAKVMRQLLAPPLGSALELNLKNKDGATALLVAVRQGKLDCVALLINAKADLDAAMDSGSTPLSEAASKGWTDILKLLIQSGAKLEPSGAVAMSKAIANGHWDAVHALIGAGVRLPATGAESPEQLMIKACQGGHKELVRCLVSAGISPDLPLTVAPEGVLSPISLALSYGKLEVVQLLCEAGARKPAHMTGKPLLLRAMEHHDEAVVKALLDAGCDPRERGAHDGRAAVHVAVERGQVELVKALLSAAAAAAAVGYVDLPTVEPTAPLTAGTRVRVRCLPSEEARAEQARFGGGGMEAALGAAGVVEAAAAVEGGGSSDGGSGSCSGVRVRMDGGLGTFGFDREVLCVLGAVADPGPDASFAVAGPGIREGASVRIRAVPVAEAEAAQQRYSGWNRWHKADLGRVGVVDGVYSGGYVRVRMNETGSICCWNRNLVEPYIAPDLVAGSTALAVAAATCQTYMAQLLLARGATPGAVDALGWAPLHHAARAGAPTGLVKALLAAGADVAQATPDGRTPLLIALEERHTALAELLLQAGARFPGSGPAAPLSPICGIPMGISAAPFIANLSRHSAGTAFHRHERV